jgi:hypothetical protein
MAIYFDKSIKFFGELEVSFGSAWLGLITLTFDLGYGESVSFESRVMLKFCWNCDEKLEEEVYIQENDRVIHM